MVGRIGRMNDTSKQFEIDRHLQSLQARGYTIIEDFLTRDDLAEVRRALAPHLRTHNGRNNFEGYKTERVYTLVARGKIFERIVEDARVLALCAKFLKPGFLLTASQAICIDPGETPQPIHSDDAFYTLPRPRPPVSVSTIVAVDAFTAENGGTEIITGSHAWGDERVANIYDNGLDTEAPADAELERQLKTVEMPAGACVFFLGTLLHRGGANRGSAPRLAFSNQYCEPWARQQENFFFGVPLQIAREMSPRLQEMLGYSIWPPFMGQVTASHPKKTLQPDYVNAVLRDRHRTP
jgi:ectoine hydroxylase-related dioxygenase (phytanoyl-CoA dioxygenase family)